MAQDNGDPVIAEGSTGHQALASVNASMAAARANHSGSTEPLNPVAYQWWLDTDADGLKVLKQRDAANTDWNWIYPVESGAGAPLNIGYQLSGDSDYNMPTLVAGGSEKAQQVQVFEMTAQTADRTITLRVSEDSLYGRILIFRPHWDEADYDVIVTGGASDSIAGQPTGGFRLAPGDVIELYAFGESPTWNVVRLLSSGVYTVTGAVTLNRHQRRVFADATGGAFSVTLPDPATVKGVEFVVKKTDAGGNAVTLASYNIDGASRSLASQYDSERFMSDGTAYFRV